MRHLITVIVAILLLAGCSSAIQDRRTKVATAQPTLAQVATVEPTFADSATTPPQPIAQTDAPGDVADLGPFIGWFALTSMLLMFVAMAGSAMYVFASRIGAAFIRRNAHLFTIGGNRK